MRVCMCMCVCVCVLFGFCCQCQNERIIRINDMPFLSLIFSYVLDH